MRVELLSLLETCKREPEDDAPRFVLADWLEEHGDEAERRRAALIRLELEGGTDVGRPNFSALHATRWKRDAARWTPFRPALPKRADVEQVRGLLRAPLGRGEAALAHGPRWAGDESWAWVESVEASPPARALPALLGSPLLTSVTALGLEGVPLTGRALDALARWPGLARLVELRLRRCRFGTGGLATLAHSAHASRLRTLDLTARMLTADDHAALSKEGAFPGLQELRLPSGPADSAAAMLAARRGLRSLSLWGALDEDGFGVLARSDRLAGLRRLRVFSFDEPMDIAALAACPFWPTLEELSLDGHALRPADAAALAGVPAAPRLRVVNADVTSAAGLKRLAASPLFASLSSLSFPYDPIRTAGARALTAMPAAPLALDLANGEIEDAGLKALARWPGLARCRVLHLGGNRLTDDGIVALADSPHAGGLVALGIDDAIGLKGVTALLSAPWLGQLEQLGLDANGGQRAAAALARAAPRLPRLRELGIAQAFRTPAVRAAFAHVEYVG